MCTYHTDYHWKVLQNGLFKSYSISDQSHQIENQHFHNSEDKYELTAMENTLESHCPLLYYIPLVINTFKAGWIYYDKIYNI